MGARNARSAAWLRMAATLSLAGIIAGAPLSAHCRGAAQLSRKPVCGQARPCCCARESAAVVCRCHAERPLPVPLRSSAEIGKRVLEVVTFLDSAPPPAADVAARSTGPAASTAEDRLAAASRLERLCVWLI
jgi:hypothetical protein